MVPEPLAREANLALDEFRDCMVTGKRRVGQMRVCVQAAEIGLAELAQDPVRGIEVADYRMELRGVPPIAFRLDTMYTGAIYR